MKVVYTQEVCNGIGKLEIDGVSVENLVWVHIHACTNTDEIKLPVIEFAYRDGLVLRRDRIPGGL